MKITSSCLCMLYNKIYIEEFKKRENKLYIIYNDLLQNL